MSSPLNIINLSSHVLTTDEISLLSKGLTFCPNKITNKFEVINYLHLYTRKLLLRSIFEKSDLDTHEFHTFSERQASKNLKSLLEENEPRDLIDIVDLESLLHNADTPTTGTSGTSGTSKSSLKKTSSLYPPPSSNQGVANFF